MAPMTSELRTADFDYDLPASSIATVAAEPRDSARLLVDRGASVEHSRMSAFPTLLRPGDVVVVNDTRVLPARVRFRRAGGGSGEALLLEERAGGWWEALVRPSAKLRPGDMVEVGDGFRIEFGDDLGQGRRVIRPVAPDGLVAALDRFGEMPLPPYLGNTVLDDPDRYQTVYAARPASAAAPTAGLHFTSALLGEVEAAGATVAHVELVVGLATFRPMTVDRVDEHVMHQEAYRIPPDTWEAVQNARRVIAVGTTTVRALESAAAAAGALEGRTGLFVRRGFDWQVVDAMLTNFHLPCSSLLVMIDAFVGPRWRELYAMALAEGYRFLSFGDAMFLERRRRGDGGGT